MMILCLMMSVSLHAASFNAWKADQAYKKGDMQAALHLYSEAAVRNPDAMDILYNVGKAAYKLKNYSTAESAFARVAQSSTSSATLKEQAFFNLGDSFLSDKNFEKALTAYQEVLNINSANEHAKKRIELIKKMKEQEQQNKPDNQKEGKDKNKQKKDSQKGANDQKQQSNDGKSPSDSPESNKSDTSDNQSSNSSNDGSGASNKSSDQSSDKRESQSSSAGENSHNTSKEKSDQSNERNEGQKQDAKNESKQPENKQNTGNKDGSNGQSESNVKDEHHPEQNGQQRHESNNKEQHDQPQKESKGAGTQNGAGSTPDQDSTITSIPEGKLSDQQREMLEAIEDNDKKAYRAFIRSQSGGNAGGNEASVGESLDDNNW